MVGKMPEPPRNMAVLRLRSQRPDVIGAGLGFAAAVSAFFPPETWQSKLFLSVAFLALTLAFLRANFTHEEGTRREQVQRDKVQAALTADVARLTGRDAQRIAATRKRARFLAERILEFLIERHASEPVKDFYTDDITDPEYEAKFRPFMDRLMAHFHETKNLYNLRFYAEAVDVTNELARSGIVDEKLLQYVQHIEPDLAESFAMRLREVAERRD